MELAAAEPLSPELVLVCPELRQAAVATLRDFTVFTPTWIDLPPAPGPAATIEEPPLALFPAARLVASTCAVATLLTLVLTLVADAVAMR